MRIALVTHRFFPAFSSGVERHILDLANQLTRMGHEAIVVTASEQSSEAPSSYAYRGTLVRTVSAVESSAGRLVDVLREEKSDVVHVMHPVRLPQAFEAAARLDLPVVAHVADFTGPGVERAAAVVSPWRSTIQRYADEGFDTTEWHHIPWGIDNATSDPAFDAPPGDELVLGSFSDGGPDVVAKALQLLPDRPIRVLRYDGSRHEEDLCAVVIPAISHENPMPGLSAVAARVPLITSDVGGLKELVDDYDCGFTYTADDPEALATLLSELCDNRALLDDVRRRIVPAPSLEEEAWRLEGIYAGCLGVEVGVPW